MAKVKLITLNPETGEIVGEINEGDKIIRKETQDYLNSTIKDFNKDEQFIKVFIKPLYELSRTLTGTESVFLNYLIQYINYADGILKQNNNVLTRNIISKETDIPLRTVDRLLSSLMEKQIIGKHKTGRMVCFTVNPFIFMRGKRIGNTLYEFYKYSKWAKMYND
jgi:hypothetical protein